MNHFVITATFKREQLKTRLIRPLHESHIVYLVSTGKKKNNVHTKHHLEATIDLVNKYQPKKFTIVIAGKLQRHNFWNSNLYPKWSKLSEIELSNTLKQNTQILTEEAIERGIEWKNNNELIIHKITCCDPVFMMWDDILNAENYHDYQQLTEKLYNSDLEYKKAVNEGALAYTAAQNKDIKNGEHMNLAKEQCIQYLLEECPLMMPNLLSSDYIIYPADPNKAMLETHERFYPGNPLPWLSIHYKFEKHKIFNPLIEGQLIGTSSIIHSKRQEKRINKQVA